MDVFDLSAKLSLDSSQYDKGLSRARGDAKSFGASFRQVGGMMAKGIAAGTAAIGALSAKAVASYANYEQLAGGVKKLYQNASNAVMKNAQEAYKTSGMSASQYMEQATSFSAALVNSLGGNYAKAAKQTDVAMRAISDNFNTFGGDMSMIQGAFQGFAKQNYTMLDNLKLGYGGTKTEMERLIQDANEYAKANGMAADLSINSFSDIVTAIDLIQQKQHIAGTTAKEAGTTIEGSVNMAKAAWENLLVGFADSKQDIGKLSANFVSALGTAANQVVPRFVEAFKGMAGAVPDVLNAIAEKAVQSIPSVFDSISGALNDLIAVTGGDTASEFFENFINGIMESAPDIATGAESIIEQLITIFGNVSDKLYEVGTTLLNGIAEGLVNGVPVLMAKVLPMIASLSGNIRANAGKLVDAGIALIMNLAQGLINSMPTIIEYVPTIVENIAGIINDNAPKLIVAGLQLMVMLAKGIAQNIPLVVKNMPKILRACVAAFTALNWASLGKTAVKGIAKGIRALGNGVKQAASRVAKAGMKQFTHSFASARKIGETVVKSIAQAIAKGLGAMRTAAIRVAKGAVQSFKNTFSNVADIGMNLVRGIWSGISSGYGWITSQIRGWVGNVKSFLKRLFGIASPSKWARDEIGYNIVRGLTEGLEDNSDMVEGAMTDLVTVPEIGVGKTVGANGDLFKNVSISNSITVDGAENPEDFANRFARQLKMDMRTA